MTFGEKLLELRRTHGMSQDTLAEKLNVSRQAVSKWERDEAAPETDKIIKLAQLFQVSTDYLLLDTTEHPRQETPPQPTPPPSQRDTGTASRAERFIRRHGYKAGYILITIGVLICLFSIGMRLLWPVIAGEFFGGFTDGFGSMMENWGSAGSSALGGLGSYDSGGQIVDENGNVIGSWEEILGSVPVLDENGNWYPDTEDYFGSMIPDFSDAFQQFGELANQAMSSAINAQANMFLLGLLPGLLLIGVGLFIIVKAKKYALEEIRK